MLQDNSSVIRPATFCPVFYSAVLVTLCELKPQFPVLSWQWYSKSIIKEKMHKFTCVKVVSIFLIAICPEGFKKKSV